MACQMQVDLEELYPKVLVDKNSGYCYKSCNRPSGGYFTVFRQLKKWQVHFVLRTSTELCMSVAAASRTLGLLSATIIILQNWETLSGFTDPDTTRGYKGSL